MRITFISDTHTKHRHCELDLPGGDLLIHAGDFMNSGYNPKLSHPFAHLPQMKSQKPFYFGGSQVPVNLAGLRKVIKRK